MVWWHKIEVLEVNNADYATHYKLLRTVDRQAGRLFATALIKVHFFCIKLV